MPTTGVAQWTCAVSNLGFIYIYGYMSSGISFLYPWSLFYRLHAISVVLPANCQNKQASRGQNTKLCTETLWERNLLAKHEVWFLQTCFQYIWCSVSEGMLQHNSSCIVQLDKKSLLLAFFFFFNYRWFFKTTFIISWLYTAFCNFIDYFVDVNKHWRIRLKKINCMSQSCRARLFFGACLIQQNSSF